MSNNNNNDSRPQTPPPPVPSSKANNNNLPFGSTPSPAPGDRLLGNDAKININPTENNNKISHHVRNLDPRHHRRTSSSQLDVIYAVDADIRRPDPMSPMSPASPASPVNNDNNGTTTTTSTLAQRRGGGGGEKSDETNKKTKKEKKKKKTRNSSVQTKLSYFGDYEHGRPVLLRNEDPEIYMGKPVCALLMFGMVIDVAVASVSYFTSWRLREPLVMGNGNQEFFSRVYPAALVVGIFVTYFVSLPVLGWVVSGYPEASKHDNYFLFAQIMYSLFFGIPAILVEALWIGPMRKDEIQFYQPNQIILSRLSLVVHCLTSGASLWYFYLVFCARKLNAAVEKRRALKIEMIRSLMGKRTCDANRVAIRTVEEIEEGQRSEEMYTLEQTGAAKFETSAAHQQQVLLEAMAEGNRNKALAAVQRLQKLDGDQQQQQHQDDHQQNKPSSDSHHPHHHKDGTNDDVVARQEMYARKTAKTIVTSPLPPLQKPKKSDEKGTQAISIGGHKFFAVSNATGGAVAAEEQDEVNGWGAPYKNPPETPPPRSTATTTIDLASSPTTAEDQATAATATVDVPPSATRNENDESSTTTTHHHRHGTNHQRTRIVGFSTNDDDDDDINNRVARNVIDDDDPFVKRK